ncbi:hypothetical protein GOB04_17750 [Sinorhizobium meliloti]|nr:hypothetical protein [Sinorhizobium meliloti]
MNNDLARSPAKEEISLETRYQVAKEMYFATAERQYSYGKWLLASLLTVHAGSLLAISQAGDAAPRLYQACGPLLIYGVAVTLIAGGLGWINFSVVANAYAFVMKDLREGREPSPTKFKRIIAAATFRITPLVAMASLGLFLVAAIRATAIL